MRQPMHHLLLSSLIITLTCTPANAEQPQVPPFTAKTLDQWREQSFSGATHYQLTEDETGLSLMAQSDSAASGLYFQKPLAIGPDSILQWRWKIGNVYQNLDEHSKAGDDFPARLYVIVSDGPFFWQKRTLVYVWSSYQPIDSRWVNPFTERAIMWAVASGAAQKNQWLTHRRNLYTDLQTAFGRRYEQIEAIAIMSDSDNSRQSATAWYGDISLK